MKRFLAATRLIPPQAGCQMEKQFVTSFETALQVVNTMIPHGVAPKKRVRPSSSASSGAGRDRTIDERG
ncbi:MAG: hypothetical protein AMJ65_09315 [Phycisphaerae bacterium SG8_4]|nr:MAG: hypothetical protein AMJ65_09315 [Phycisphaerae bacterium SG8_4]